MMTSWHIRCANNINLSSCRYSSRRVLSVCLYHRVSTAYHAHVTVAVKTSTKNLPSPARLLTAMPSDSMTGISLLKLRPSFNPLPSRDQRRSPARRLQDRSQCVTLGSEFLQEQMLSPSGSTEVRTNPLSVDMLLI